VFVETFGEVRRDSIRTALKRREFSPLKLKDSDIDRVSQDGAKRLLERAEEPRSLTPKLLAPRIRHTVEKYLLRADDTADAAALSQFVDTLQADDLCLIVACEKGDQNAWNDLVERFSPTVRSAARSASPNEDAAEDLSQSIWAELHGLRIRKDGQPAGKLSYYSGRGSLAGWLRAVVAQLAVDEHRKQARLVQTEEDTDLDRLAQESASSSGLFETSASINPEETVTSKFAGAEVQKALESAIKNLADEDRLLVKLYYFDDLRLREAGALLGVHEATASRRLTKIHNELRRRVGEILVKQRGWSETETERAFAEVALNLQTDIEPMLVSETVTGVLPGGKGAKIRR
jgi:RNA polymerase sigma-70 factor (ECF subfamily)